MAQLGDVLTAPEAGWKSYSDSEIEEILYRKINNGKDQYYYFPSSYLSQDAINTGNNIYIKVPVFYDHYSATSNTLNSLVSFKITGDKVRIISIYEERAKLYKEKILILS